jgi:hypothetical protein
MIGSWMSRDEKRVGKANWTKKTTNNAKLVNSGN